jgi:hypothetical protein
MADHDEIDPATVEAVRRECFTEPILHITEANEISLTRQWLGTGAGARRAGLLPETASESWGIVEDICEKLADCNPDHEKFRDAMGRLHDIAFANTEE